MKENDKPISLYWESSLGTKCDQDPFIITSFALGCALVLLLNPTTKLVITSYQMPTFHSMIDKWFIVVM